VLQLLGAFALLAFFSWKLLMMALAVLPLVFFSHRQWIRRIRPLHNQLQDQRQRLDAQTTEVFGGLRVVRAFGRERSEDVRFARATHQLARCDAMTWWRTRTLEVVWGVTIPAIAAALWLYGGFAVLQGELTLGELMVFVLYLALLLEPLAALANRTAELQEGLAALDRILDYFASPADVCYENRSAQAIDVQGHIAFQNVSLTYPGATRPALVDVSFEARPGETVALVGASGAGKTSLCGLIARSYQPTAGSIEVDGQDVRQLDWNSYQRLLGIVEQDVFMFDGTVYDNIAYGRRGATREEIEDAAWQANAHEFIVRLSQGYDTVIGERGARLSGGQRQRLAIARVVLRSPRILILDEATSNLDVGSEQPVTQSLKRLARGRTCFVVAHRMTSIVDADQILVLEHGRIIDRGSHRDLVRRCAHYRAILGLNLGDADLSPSAPAVSFQADRRAS